MKTKFRNCQTKINDHSWVITLDGIPAAKDAAFLFKYLKTAGFCYRVVNSTTKERWYVDSTINAEQSYALYRKTNEYVSAGNITVESRKLIYDENTGEVIAREQDVLRIMVYKNSSRLIPTSR